MRDKQTEKTSALLHRLNSAECGAAWCEFMDRYAPLVMKVVTQFEYEQNRADDCFLYVCEKLSDDGFRRLLKFNTDGKASFSTWLAAVVFNLCVDWHRKEFGRVQVLPAITALPAFDQAVYRLNFEENLSFESCFESLLTDFPDLTRRQLSEAIGRVHRSLTPRQRWQISVRKSRSRSAVQHNLKDPDRLTCAGTDPLGEAQSQQQVDLLKTAIDGLDTEQRLVLHLRFQQGLTLKMISVILGLPDPFHARRRIESAIRDLRRQVTANGKALGKVHRD